MYRPDARISQLHPHAQAAARAARAWHIWGPYAAGRYAAKRGVPPGILTLARVLAVAERAGVQP